MSDERFDWKSPEANKRYLCSCDSDDNHVVYKRKRFHYQDEHDDEPQEFGEEEEFGEGEEVSEVREELEFGAEEEFGEEESYWVESASSSNKRIKDMRLIGSEATMTSVLSKRWQFLWTDLPRLEFWESSSQTEKIRKFVARVHRTLVICSGNHLENFEVDFMYDKCFASDVNVWVEFAVKIRLYLEKVELHQRVIEKILSGCPVLYDLILKACWGFHCLMIDSQSLHELTITDRKEGNVESLLEISAPYIHSLWISLYPKGRKLRLTNISSIVRAGIDFNGFDSDAGSVKVMSYTKELFENLQHVKELELGRGCIEVLSMLAVKGWQLPQSSRGYLIVNASRDKQSIPGILGLLESSPKLETLVVNGSYDPYEASATCSPAASYLKKGDLNCDLLHLRTVNITSFADPDLAGEPMLTLVQLLLKRAKVLEKNGD
ncbi:hypothetical protein Pfo_028309 [Paulownia fortunei]|nr:hypothetical protein Pfo_028309 [Paulownia fortunei]